MSNLDNIMSKRRTRANEEERRLYEEVNESTKKPGYSGSGYYHDWETKGGDKPIGLRDNQRATTIYKKIQSKPWYMALTPAGRDKVSDFIYDHGRGPQPSDLGKEDFEKPENIKNQDAKEWSERYHSGAIKVGGSGSKTNSQGRTAIHDYDYHVAKLKASKKWAAAKGDPAKQRAMLAKYDRYKNVKSEELWEVIELIFEDEE